MSKQFKVVELFKDGSEKDAGLSGVIFNDAQLAQGAIGELRKTFPNGKFQIRQVLDEAWRNRENDRLNNGEYPKVLWHKARWAKAHADHYVHLSLDNPRMLAYTESPEKGGKDVQTRISPSKYLNRFYLQTKILSEKTVRSWVAKHKKAYGAEYEFKLAYKPDEIVHVYEHCNSCMSGYTEVEVYAGPDLAVAYIEKNKRIVSRCIVWPKKKIHTPYIYGDIEMMEIALDEEGYKSGSIKGARITKKKLPKGYGGGRYGNGYVLPSIDGICTFEEDGKYLILGR